jgi:hypothetical protein
VLECERCAVPLPFFLSFLLFLSLSRPFPVTVSCPPYPLSPIPFPLSLSSPLLAAWRDGDWAAVEAVGGIAIGSAIVIACGYCGVRIGW